MTQVRLPRPVLSPRRLAQVLGQLAGESVLLVQQPGVQKWGRWSLAAFAATIMWDADWPITLATASGVAGVALIYCVLNPAWRPEWRRWLLLTRTHQGQLALSAVGGALLALGCYGTVLVWANASDRWLATAILLEGMATLITLGLLIWQITQQRPQHQYQQWEQLLLQLAEGDRLQRLIIIRQLGKRLQQGQLSTAEQSELRDYFQLLWSQETDPHIRQALLDYFPISPVPTPTPIPRVLNRRLADKIALGEETYR